MMRILRSGQTSRVTAPTVRRALARCSATVLATLLLWVPSVSAQEVSAQEADRLVSDSSSVILPHPEAPLVPAVRASSSIRIDGMPDEAAWAAATPMTNFTQIDPFEGEPVSQPTEVRFLYDDAALYIGGRFYDSGPIMTRFARRDAGVSDSDLFTVSIDSYHDHQTSYRFTTNPSGLKRDATVTGGGRGFGGGGDSSWDPIWDVASAITDEGWFTEMRIPFSQLRFSPGDEMLWGIQAERNIRRIEETAVFSFTPKLEPGGVARYGHLTGLRGIGAGKKLEVLPYVGMRAEYIYQEPSSQVAFNNPFRSGSDYFGRAGVDLKYRLASNLTLDATANPDFGQVEVDPAVINLTAFETRFPERRPFFVEGAEIFTFGRGGPRGSTGRAPEILHSRRIGRRPQGHVSPSAVFSNAPVSTTILGAAKITGKVGDGWSLGFIDAVTGQEFAPYVDVAGVKGQSVLEPVTNYLAGRLRRDTRAGETQLGMIATAVHRDIEDPALAAQLRSAAYVTGVDLVHEWANRGWRTNSAFATSYIEGGPAAILGAQQSSARYLQRPDATHLGVDSTATGMGGFYAMVDINKQRGSLGGRVSVAYLSPGYEVNDLGFQSESDRFIFDTSLTWRHPQPGGYFRDWSFSVGGPDIKWNTAGERIFGNFSSMFRWRWLNYWGGIVRVDYEPESDDDRLTRGGPIARTPGSLQGSFNLNSDSRNALSFRTSYSWWSDAADSWRHNGSINFTYKSGEKLELRLGPSVTRSYSTAQYVTLIADPLATATFGRRYVFAPIDQTTVSVETRLNVTFSPTLTLQVYVQPLISSGDYRDLAEFRAPGTFRFSTYGQDIGTGVRQGDGNYLIDPDGTGPAPEFTVSDRSFNFRSLLGNAVLRWEWSPGSTLFLVWQQSRAGRTRASEFDETGALDVGLFDLGYDTRELFGLRSDNIFLVKVNYWLNL